MIHLLGSQRRDYLPTGNPDNDPEGLDTTNNLTSTGIINIKDVDDDLSSAAVVLNSLPTGADNEPLTSRGREVTWVQVTDGNGNTTNDWVGQVTDADGVTKDIISIDLADSGKLKEEDGSYDFSYTVTLLDSVDHSNPDIEDILNVSFGVAVVNNGEAIASDDKVVVIIEDDSPVANPVTYNIDVPVDTIRISGLETGFVQTEFTSGSQYNVATQVKDLNGVASGTGQITYPQLSYNGGTNIERAQLDGDFMDEGVYWGLPYGNNLDQPAGYETFENESYEGQGQTLAPSVDSFNLGTFTHENYTVDSASGSLKNTTLRADFTVDINGVPTDISETFLLRHIETPNSYYSPQTGGLVSFSEPVHD